MNEHKIIIDEELRGLIPPLTGEEYSGLEESIIAEGCRDALVVWGDILVDGHNRYEICRKHGIAFRTEQKEFSDRDEAKLWMMKNQLSRRNLNDFQRIEITHKCEDAVKAKAKEQQIRKPQESVMEIFPEQKPIVARDELGAMAGVSGKTYEHAVKVMEKAPDPVVDVTRKGEVTINKAYQVTKAEPEQQSEIARRIENIADEPEETNTPTKIIDDVLKKPHVTNNSGNNEWYTPKQYIDLAKAVLGGIDVDPASCEYANRTVQAEKYYSVDNDGLEKDWKGRVWMNPPYAADLVTRFTEKYVKEYQSGNITSGIVLVNNATETKWFINMVGEAKAVAFTKGRIRYDTQEKGDGSGAPLQGQAFLYFGYNPEKFMDVFSKVGWCAVIPKSAESKIA